MTHKTGRPSQYVEDYPNLTVHPLNCVPDERPKGSWTNGVKAYKKGTTSKPSELVGWFYPPRLRNKGHRNYSQRKRLPFIEEE